MYLNVITFDAADFPDFLAETAAVDNLSLLCCFISWGWVVWLTLLVKVSSVSSEPLELSELFRLNPNHVVDVFFFGSSPSSRSSLELLSLSDLPDLRFKNGIRSFFFFFFDWASLFRRLFFSFLLPLLLLLATDRNFIIIDRWEEQRRVE